MASDLFRLRTMLTPASSEFRRACYIGSTYLVLAVILIPFQSLPSLAETAPESIAVEAVDGSFEKERLKHQVENEVPEPEVLALSSGASSMRSPAQLAAPAEMLAWAMEGSIGDTFTKIISQSSKAAAAKPASKAAVTPLTTERSRFVEAATSKVALDTATAQVQPDATQGTKPSEGLPSATSESVNSAADAIVASSKEGQTGARLALSFPLTAATVTPLDDSADFSAPLSDLDRVESDAIALDSPPQFVAAPPDQKIALTVVPPKAETVSEVQSRLAPAQVLPTPPQVAPVHAGDAPNSLVPTSQFGGAFGNAASNYNASNSGNYLAQAYPQAGYPQAYPQPVYPQAAYPPAAYPQPVYPQAAYPQAYPQPGYPQAYPQPGYYYPQAVQPGYAPAPQAYAPYPPAPYYPQAAYPPAAYPPQAYVAQPYPQYPQPYQVQPYANPGYAAAYPQPGYPQQPYVAPGYPAQNYAAQPYPQPGYGYPAPGVTTAVQLPPVPAPGSAAPNGLGQYNAGQYNAGQYVANPYGSGNVAAGYPQRNAAPANLGQPYANNGYGQPNSIGGRSELPPPPSFTLGDTAFALPAAPRGLSNATSAAVPPQALSEINLNRLPQIPTNPSPLEIPNAAPVAADTIPAGIGGPLDFEAPTLELPPPPLQPRQEVNLPFGEPAPTFRSTALGQPTSQLQAVFLSQGGDSAARARLSGTYPMTPNILFGASFDVASGDSFTDSTNGFSVNEAFASTSLAQLPNLRITAGQMDLTSYFDRNSFAKDSATHFFNPVFQTNPALSAVGLGSRPGVLANWSATDNLDLKVAAYSSSGEIGEFALDGFAGEVGFRKGNAIVRATYASGRDDGSRDSFQEIFNIDRGNGRSGVQKGDREEAYGVNGEVFLPNLNAGIFGRYGRYENRDLGESGDSYSLGLSFLDVFTDEDRLGLAFGRNISNDDLRRRFDEDTPNVLELFYDFRFLPNLRMGFTIQERDSFSELAAGFRLKAEFDTLPAGNLSEVR